MASSARAKVGLTSASLVPRFWNRPLSENLVAFKIGATLVAISFAAGMPLFLWLRAHLRSLGYQD